MANLNGGYIMDSLPKLPWMETPEQLQVHSVWQRKPVCQGEQPVHFVRQRSTNRCSIDEDGLEGSRTWNTTEKGPKKIERTLLLQCREHYSDFGAKFPEWADHLDKEEAPMGEQLFVSGMDAETICIGDLFASDESSLEVKVVFPRLPCFRVDKRFPVDRYPEKRPLRSGEPGTVRQWIGASGKGGFFCSVQRPGDVADGDCLKLVQRPCPGWTLQRISNLCYPTTPIRMAWQGSDAELKELCEMDELGSHEWKERLINIRSSILKERPLEIPDWMGSPMLQEEGEDFILGLWKIVGSDEEYVELVLAKDGVITSKRPQFEGSYFTAKPQEEEEDYTLDAQMGGEPVVATMNGFGPAGGRALLVFSDGCMWSRVGDGELDSAAELSFRSSDTRYPNSLSLRSCDSRYPNSWSRSSSDRKYKPATVADLFFGSE